MKKTLFIFVLVGMMMFFSFSVLGQPGLIHTALSVKVVNPLTLTENQPMHFGTITVSSQAGTCAVSTAGVRSRTGGVTLQSIAPFMTLATYTVSGEPLRTYAITLPLTITVFNGAYSMTIGTLLAKSASGSISHTATGSLGVGGSEQFVIGGTLNVSGGQAQGLYQGTFNLTVAYN